MDIFNEKISEMLETIRKEEKFCYLLGDRNINILNYESHRLTGDFVDLLSSYSFLPLITRPTRITASSATLIDNIFTNHIENLDHSTQGLLVTDILDHYPIFHINNRSCIGEQTQTQTQTQTEFYSTSIEIKSVTSGCKNNMVENKR